MGCETYSDAFLGQPANAISSLAFIAAGIGIVVRHRRRRARATHGVRNRQILTYGVLVAGIGVGSFIQHGPHPSWQAYAHDVTLAATLLFVAADAASDVTDRELSPMWWLIPSVAMIPVVAAGATASTVVQGVLAAAAIGLSLLRARVRPELRRTVLASSGVLALGSLLGSLTDRTWLCDPDSLVQGHAAWHVLAAVALWLLVPAIGDRRVHQASVRSR